MSGSTGCSYGAAPSTTAARSSRVTACRAPIENFPTRPVTFAGAENRRLRRRLDVDGVAARQIARALRRSADPPRVEQVAVVEVEVEVSGPLDEERPALVEERLERRQVDDGGIGFHLPEIRIHRRR